jgi:hypothetical protein
MVYSKNLNTEELMITMVYFLKVDKRLIHNISSLPNHNKQTYSRASFVKPNKTRAW